MALVSLFLRGCVWIVVVLQLRLAIKSKSATSEAPVRGTSVVGAMEFGEGLG